MRYYSTTAGEMVLQAAISPSDTTLVVDTTSGLPVTFPYTLILDYGSNTEEVVDVTAGASTTLTVTRGRDGTVAQGHDFGAKVRHGVTARDYRESREHEASTSAHGVTGSVVGTDGAQTLKDKTASASAAGAKALVVKAVSGQTATILEVQDGAGDARVGVDPAGTLIATPAQASPGVKVTQPSTATAAGVKVVLDKGLGTDDEISLSPGQSTSLSYTQGDYGLTTPASVTVTDHGNTTIRQSVSSRAVTPTATLTVQGGAVGLGATTETDILSLRSKADGEVLKVDSAGNVIASGDITAANLTSIETTVADHGTRLGAVETNLGSQTTFAATSAAKDGKRMHWGMASGTGDASGYFNVTHGAGFTPSAVVMTWSSSGLQFVTDNFTSTTFRVRVLNSDGSVNSSTPMTLSYFCGE